MGANERLRQSRPRLVSATAASAELDARTEAERQRIEAQTAAETAKANAETARIQAQGRSDVRAAQVTQLEAITRFVLAGVLVLGTIGIVIWGVAGNRSPQLVSPVAALAGLAVGYFFGRRAD